MAAIVLDGKEIAREIEEELKGRIGDLSKDGVTPCLAVVIVGNDRHLSLIHISEPTRPY